LDATGRGNPRGAFSGGIKGSTDSWQRVCLEWDSHKTSGREGQMYESRFTQIEFLSTA